MEEEIIIVIKPPKQQQIAAFDAGDPAAGTTVASFSNRADAIAWLAGELATDDRS